MRGQACDYSTLFAAEIDLEAEEAVGTIDRFSASDLADAEIQPPELGQGNPVGGIGAGHREPPISSSGRSLPAGSRAARSSPARAS
jgi:hypothetical protein